MDYFYEINYKQNFEEYNKNNYQQFNKDVDLFLVFGVDNGDLMILEIKNVCESQEVFFLSMDQSRQKKYFHRIEDVNLVK